MKAPNALPGARENHLRTQTSTTSPLASKGGSFFVKMQEALIGSPSDEDEEEDDANPGGTVEATASASTNASRPRAMHHTKIHRANQPFPHALIMLCRCTRLLESLQLQ